MEWYAKKLTKEYGKVSRRFLKEMITGMLRSGSSLLRAISPAERGKDGEQLIAVLCGRRKRVDGLFIWSEVENFMHYRVLEAMQKILNLDFFDAFIALSP